jgi:O-antigen/teichoic acid export membrane protein
MITMMGAVGGVLAARLLGPTGRGELAAAVVWTAIALVVVGLGMPQSLTYYSAANRGAEGSILVTALVMLVVQSAAGIAIGQIAVSAILSQVQPTAAGLVSLYMWSIPFSLLVTYISTIAQGLRRFRTFNGLRVLASSLYPAAVGLAPLLGMRDAYHVVVLLLIAQVMVAAASLVWFWFQMPPGGRFRTDLACLLLRYGLQSYAGNISWLANARLDQFIMSVFVNLESLGHYAVATSFALVLFPISGAFANLLFPSVVGQDRKAAATKISRALRHNLIISAVGALLLALVSPKLLPLFFGSDYAHAVAPAQILLAGTVLLGCNYLISDSLRGLGRPLWPSLAEMMGLAFTVGGLLVLLPRLGILGAAIVSVVSYSAAFVMLSVAARRELRRSGVA